MTNPVYSYPHAFGDASITGGFVYQGTQFPAEYRGDYFFADYAMNWIKRLELDANGNVTAVRNFEPPDGQRDGPYGDIVALAEGPDGSLWYVDTGPFENENAGAIRRIRNTSANQPPSARIAGTPTTGTAPLNVSFSSAGSADPEGLPITYRWDFGDGATSTQANPSHTYAAAGRYTVRLTTSDGAMEAVSEPLAITAGSPPVPRILTPTTGQTFRAGEVIAYSGDATDAEDGALPASALNWKIVFHHDTHIHPVIDGATGTTGSVTIPTTGHSFKGDTSYEIVLTATDSNGIQASQSVTIRPQKANLTFATAPAGLTVSVDGVPATSPFTASEIVGFQYAVDTPSPQSGSTFASWSDGGAKAHTVTVPRDRHDADGDVQRAAGGQPRRRLQLQRGQRHHAGGRDRQGPHRHADRADVVDRRQDRRRAVVRRRQRLGAHRRRQRPRLHDRDDARGVGAADDARQLADGAVQGAVLAHVVRAVRRDRQQPAERTVEHRRRARRALPHRAADGHLEPPRRDLRRQRPAVVRERHAGGDAQRERRDGASRPGR